MPCAQLKASCKEASSVLGVRSTWLCWILTGSICHMYISKTLGTGLCISAKSSKSGIKSYILVSCKCWIVTPKIQTNTYTCGSLHTWRHLKGIFGMKKKHKKHVPIIDNHHQQTIILPLPSLTRNQLRLRPSQPVNQVHSGINEHS